MADLHYEKGNMKALERLHIDYKKYVDCVERQRWNPDYIVIAGDVINWTLKHDPNKYDYAKQGLDGIINDFNIKKDHIIIIPGNHDNALSNGVKIKELDKSRDIFEKFCNNEEGLFINDFKNEFLPRFKDYIKFCEPYIGSTEYNDPSIIADELKSLSGVKIFEEDHLCFILVNTEWLYIPKDPFETNMKKIVAKGISTHMKLYEKCQLCTLLIKDAYEYIKSKYPDYTVITVMHRGFEDLTWKENNPSDKMNIDAIKYIKSVSDIILTGHDHNIVMEPPTLINNKIQHFKLGSVGRKEPKTREYIRTASIIRISPAACGIELLNMEYNKDKSRWLFKPDHNIYPLFSKYRAINVGETVINNYNRVIIRAKGVGSEDIIDAIQGYYKYLSDLRSPSVIIDAYDVSKNSLEAYKTCMDKGAFCVIYFKCYNDDFCDQELIDKIDEEVYLFRKKHYMSVFTNKIIIGKIFVQIPIFDNF